MDNESVALTEQQQRLLVEAIGIAEACLTKVLVVEENRVLRQVYTGLPRGEAKNEIARRKQELEELSKIKKLLE